MIEVVFFILAILPRWWTCWMKQKTAMWWFLYAYTCAVWIVYYSAVHWAPAGLFNNVVELAITTFGWSCLVWPRRENGTGAR